MGSRARGRRVSKSAGDRRREIMDAALTAFAEKGLAGATVGDITAAAGVAKGTFYLYFDSKDHLVAALRERFVDELTEHAMPFLERMGRDDWWTLADAVAEDMVDWTLDHRDSIAFLTQAYTPETHELLADADRKLTLFLATGLRAGAEAGAFQVTDPELTASFLYNGIIYTVVQQLHSGAEVDRDHLVSAAKELGRKILAP